MEICVLTNTTVLGGPGAIGLSGNATLVVVLERRVGEAVVAVVRQDSGGLALTIKYTLAILGRVVGVKGRLVPWRVVPLLVEVDFTIVGPVLTIGPAIYRLG